jgi:NhaC family Na+:H+ antiporter
MDAITGKVVILLTMKLAALFYFRRNAKNARHNLVDYLRYGFGGIMDAIGALSRISNALLKLAHTTLDYSFYSWKLFSLNITASDQYLAIVVPGKMFAKAYEDKGLAPENLSRTLEDAGTVTSVLTHLVVPINQALNC